MYDKIILALSLEHGIAEQALETARRLGGKDAEIIAVHVYEGAGHGFNCDARGSYEADSAAVALERTLNHFATCLS